MFEKILDCQKIQYSYDVVSEFKMLEPEEEIMPLMQQLTLSRCAVSMIDPFRDDPPSEDDLDSDVETLETSEEGIMKEFPLS